MAQEIHAGRGPVLAFGPFQLFPEQRALYRAGNPLRLGSRAREILFALVEKAGETVRKSELMARVWPGMVVEDGALRVHIFALRKALGCGMRGADYVETINGHGYRLNARIRRVELALPDAADGHRNDAVDPAQRLIGRERELASLCRKLPQDRLLTLAGPAGVGKSRLAAAAQDSLRAAYPGAIRLIDVASADGPGNIEAIVREAAPLASSAPDDVAPARILLVLDNCDHHVELVATLAEKLIRETRQVDLLVTTREPLQIAGESLIRLSPFALPSPESALTVESAIEYPALQLFALRAGASDYRFQLNEENVQAVGKICRSLDGLPLAIELAAAHAGTLGLSGLAALIDEPLRIPARGRRTASATHRHRSLRAALDWTFPRLSDEEREMLCLLAQRAGDFDLSSIMHMLSKDLRPDRVAELFASLAEKSLIVPVRDSHDGASRFQILTTTRAYAKEYAKAPSRARPQGAVESAEARVAVASHDAPSGAIVTA